MTKLKGKSRSRIRKKKRVLNGVKVAAYQRKLLSMIRKYDDPILSEKCVEDVKNINEDIMVIDYMSKVLKTTKTGVGIAACQIGFLRKIIALRFDVKKSDVKIMINPVIKEHSSNTTMQKEACLSYPGIGAIVTRYKDITVTYFDEDMKEQEQSFSDFKARVIQHEMDHIEGICEVKDEYNRIKEEERIKAEEREKELNKIKK
jgi:peptide deformylase